MQTLHIAVLSCTKYSPLLRGFAHQFNKYAGADLKVHVVLDDEAPFQLPPNFEWDTFPAMKGAPWTDVLNTYLSKHIRRGFMVERHPIMILLDDYWLVKPINRARLGKMTALVQQRHPIYHKADLSNNTNHFPHVRIGDGLVVAKQDAPYRTSLQPAIWDVNYLAFLTRPGLNPWQFELQGKATNDGCRIIGPDDGAVYEYANVFLKGRPDDGQMLKVPAGDVAELTALGCWPPSV